ncbi:hypothetical protein [Streptomyces abyssalis]|uniref:hypothetical protein n=1 Tax=Streptomyces abyssalis TaxID=933944 RepID=UPI001112F565|nr:hypothetical protein [Streptomyces abyssalis]
MVENITQVIIGIFGVLGLVIAVLRGLLEQLPKLFESWRKARQAWREGEVDEPEPLTHRNTHERLGG